MHAFNRAEVTALCAFDRAEVVGTRASGRSFAIAILAAILAGGIFPYETHAQAARDSAPPHPLPQEPRTPPGRSMRAERVAWIDSLKQPESVVHDAKRNVHYVSNINGMSLGKDNNGFISRLRGDGTKDQLMWIVGGRNGVTLHAPKGMALAGDTLWVSDIDAMRAFSVTTGRPLATVDLAGQGATFLNDVAVGGDGAVYVTDTRVRPDTLNILSDAGADRVFRIASGRGTVALETERLSRPNGIAWDRSGGRFVIVPFGGDTIYAWRPGDTSLHGLGTGPGRFDGVVQGPRGEWLVSSKATGSVHAMRGGRLVALVEHIGDVADIEWNGSQGLLLVPLTAQNRVDVFRVRP